MKLIVGSLLAHGVSSQEDLPLPFKYALTGAAVALLLSFAALGVLWRRPLLQNPTAGLPFPAWAERVLDSGPFRSALQILGCLLFIYVAIPAVFAPRNEFNPTGDVVFVLFWVGLVLGSLLFGPFWRLLNPLRTVASLLADAFGIDSEQGLRQIPANVGYWPAASGLLAFTWLELVFPDRDSPNVLVACIAVYSLIHITAGIVYGGRWFDRGEAFEVYSNLIGSLALVGRRPADGRLVLRAPLRGLPGVQVAPGLVAVVTILLGSTAFDALTGTTLWEDRGPVQPTLGAVMAATVAMAIVYSLVAALFLVACLATARAAAQPVLPIARAFAHTLVPVVAGYAIAHYFTLYVFSGQQGLILLSDPLQNGANLLGLTGRPLYTELFSRTTIATVQITAILIGHLLGVVAAHDKAVGILPPQRAVLGQLPLLLLMVVYTVGGITLLFSA